MKLARQFLGIEKFVRTSNENPHWVGHSAYIGEVIDMVATELIGGVLGAEGSELVVNFHYALAVCAFACVGASASAFLLITVDA